MIGSARNNLKDVAPLFKQALEEDFYKAVRIMLWARDCRGGAGERATFQECLGVLRTHFPKETSLLLKSNKIPEIGRWDDLIPTLVDDSFNLNVRMKIAEDLKEKILSRSEQSSLIAKWLPRKGKEAAILRTLMGLSPKQYRRMVVDATQVVETLMCANQWEKIEIEKMPSVALSRSISALTRHVPEKVSKYKEDLESGKTKIKTTQLYPHDVVRVLKNGDAAIANQQWKNLPDYFGDSQPFFPIIDVSSSMEIQIGRSSLECMDVAIGLGIYCAERLPGRLKNLAMTFDKEPFIIKIPEASFQRKYDHVRDAPWGANTDLQKVFDLLLEVYRTYGADSDIAPKSVLIISDMEFDEAVNRRKTNFKEIDDKFKKDGFKRPNIVFWNVVARANNLQVKKDENGTAMISGFSPTILKNVMKGDLNPMNVMLDTIMVSRYAVQDVTIKG